MSKQKINCLVSQCKHNGRENFCELRSIKISGISEKSSVNHDTLCSNFEE